MRGNIQSSEEGGALADVSSGGQAAAVLPTPDASDLSRRLGSISAKEMDELPFGVIGFDADEVVVVYNEHESALSGLPKSRVLGRSFFHEVAPCTDNALVAGRFRAEGPLDEELDYVFTLRMKPTPVHLRLLGDPSAPLRYMIVVRPSPD